MLNHLQFVPLCEELGYHRASHRFERGTDIENLIFAVTEPLPLNGRLSGGEVPDGIIDEYPINNSKTFAFRPERRGENCLGEEIAAEEWSYFFFFKNRK